MLSDGRFEKQKGDSNLEKEDRIRQKEQWKQPVSYTHLTLPTICSV